jgi:small subunit ribosomal protein S16
MLKIRLQRVGRKHEPVFRIVVTDSKNSTKSGRFHEIVGSLDARKKGFDTLSKKRAQYWMSKGAQLTPRVHNLFIDEKIIEGKKINVLPKKTPIVKETPQTESREAPASSEAVPVVDAPAKTTISEEKPPIVEAEKKAPPAEKPKQEEKS